MTVRHPQVERTCKKRSISHSNYDKSRELPEGNILFLLAKLTNTTNIKHRLSL